MKCSVQITDNNGIVSLPRVFRGEELAFVSITSGKGGVGKSSVVVNLALALKSLGGRILVLDGDLGLANIDQLLGVHAVSTLWDVCQGTVSLEEAIVDTEWGISLISACSGRKKMALLNEKSRRELLRDVRQLGDRFDYVIIDTAAGIGETALGMAQAGDIVLAVVTSDPTSVRDAFSIMKILAKECGVKNIDLIANMVSSHEEGVDLFRRISSVTQRFLPLTLGLCGVICKDPLMVSAVMERQPVVGAFPEAIVSKQFKKLASHIVRLKRELVTQSLMDNGQGNH